MTHIRLSRDDVCAEHRKKSLGLLLLAFVLRGVTRNDENLFSSPNFSTLSNKQVVKIE